MSNEIYDIQTMDEIDETVELKLNDPDLWMDYVKSRTDIYGQAIVDFARRWGKAMQCACEEEGYALDDVAFQLSYDAGRNSLTGIMFDTGLQMLGDTWEYGDELYDWYDNADPLYR